MKVDFFLDQGALLLCAAALFLAAIIPACDLNPSSQESDPSSCSATIRFGESASRNVLPTVPTTVTSYAVSGTGPGDARFELSTSNGWVQTNLLPGAWNIEVSALNEDDLVLLEGSASAIVEAGSSVEIQVELAPRAGVGALRVSFSLPSSTSADASVELSLESVDASFSGDRSVSSPYDPILWESLPAGYYRLSATMTGGAASCGCVEAVRVLADTETAFLADFASTPGSASIVVVLPNISPLWPLLPTWTRWSAAQALPLAATDVPGDATLSWSLDGSALSGAVIPAGGLALGVRRVDIFAVADGSNRAGSANRSFTVNSGASSGSWSWWGSYSADPDACASLPGGNGFLDIAATSGGSLVAALDGPSSGSSSSAVHLFSADSSGNLFPTATLPLRVSGSLRSADRLAMAADGSALVAWADNSTWIGFLAAPSGGTLAQLDSSATFATWDATALSQTTLKTRCAAFSRDGSTAYVLSSGASRVMAFSIASGAPALLWSRALEFAELGTATFSAVAVDAAGVVAVLTTTGDAAVLIAADGGAAALIRKPQADWLDAPVDLIPEAGGGFLTLCSDSGVIGRLSLAVDADGLPAVAAERVSSGAAEPYLTDSGRIAITADGSAIAVSGARSGRDPSPRYLSIFPTPFTSAPSIFSEAPGAPVLETATAVAWLGRDRFFVADGSTRAASLFVEGP